MGENRLIYASVARGTVILADYGGSDGNIADVAQKCLQNIPTASGNDGRFTYAFDGHSFNYLFSGSFVFCVVADASIGRQVPMAFLERIKDDFIARYGRGKAANAPANSLSKEYGVKLKEQMQYCSDHPEEISKLAKVQAQVSEVKSVMTENIQKVIDRGEKVSVLVDKTEDLQNNARSFQKQGNEMRRKMWLQNMKIKLTILGILIALILIIVLSICHGFSCLK
ncbi:hypothetical protein QJS10_CPB11g01463 [Acorus calamus]|uniref:Uncharacterized protein n=1 Tax=Acorus calamus TaxID=4465 RepID=A0AAV9DRW4_ACOCL|nr:hypothetical protein QJS10_CPB11g01463 [Acorus calamus]